MSKTKFEVDMKHLKVLLKWNRMIKFYLWICTISLNFEIHFLEFPLFFGAIISGNYLYLKLLENAKSTITDLNLVLRKVFVHLKLKLFDFLSDVST